MALNNEKEKITLEGLALMIKESEKKIIEAVDVKIDKLAMMTKHGFDNVDERFKNMDERFDKMDERFDKMDERFDKADERFDKFEKTNSQDHENARLRLGEVAYRFELVDLKKRVEVLEQKEAVRV